jgi:hypothetical protein
MSKHEDRGRVPILHAPENAYPFANIPELFPELEALPAATLQHLLDLDGDALEAAVEIAIRILDARQGDIDLEDNHDREEIDERENDECDREDDDPLEDDDPPEDDDPGRADASSPIDELDPHH